MSDLNNLKDKEKQRKTIGEWWDATKPSTRAIILLVGFFVCLYGIIMPIIIITTPVDKEEDKSSSYRFVEEEKDTDYSTGTLLDYMMTLEEYREYYISSGFKYTEHSHEYEMGDFCKLYENETTGREVIIYDFDESIGVWVTAGPNEIKDYEDMLSPAFLYIKDLPGAILDVDMLVKKWDINEKELPAAGIYESCFKVDGIEYIRNRDTNTGKMITLVKAFKDYEVDTEYKIE